MPFVPRALLVLAACAAMAPATAQDSGYTGHGAGSIAAEVVARYAPEPLGPGVSRRIQQALDLRPPGSGELSPDGRRLYFSWSISGVAQVWRLDGPGRFPVQMTGGADRTGLEGITPDGRTLAISRDRGGQEDPGLYLQDADGGPLRLVQHLPGSRARFALATPDSRQIYFVANDREVARYTLYRYDLGTGEKVAILDEPGLWFVADHRHDSGEPVLLMGKLVSSRAQEYYALADGRLEPLFGQGEEGRYVAAWGRDPGEVLVATDAQGEFRRLYRWTRRTGFTPISPEAGRDVAFFTIDQARRRITYTLNDGGYTRAFALDAGTLAPLALPEFPGADHVRPGSSTPDGRYQVIRVSSPRGPTVTHVLDWETGRAVPWTVPSAPEADLGRFAVPRLEHYPARDGTPIPVFVRYPEGCESGTGAGREPCPVIVKFHGGPESQALPGFDPVEQLFVDAGFVLAEPNVRGSSGYGRAWLDADNGPKRLQILTDIEDAARYFRARLAVGGREPRVGVTGGSYGGYSTLVAMTIFAGAYDAGAAIVGMSDLRTFLRNTAPYRRQLRVSEYGDPQTDAAALARLAPIEFLDRVRGPVLLIQGVDDPRVPAGEAVQMHEAMRARGLPAELILLAGEGHGAARRDSQVIQYGHTLRFFEEHLLGKQAAGGIGENAAVDE